MLLPPSETKRSGGDKPPLRLRALSTPALTGLRTELVGELVDLAADPQACRRALGISAAQDEEITRNAGLRLAPAMPAIHRYTGVLYDALDAESLTGAAATRAMAERRSRLRTSDNPARSFTALSRSASVETGGLVLLFIVEIPFFVYGH